MPPPRPPQEAGDLPVDGDLSLFARIEGLIGEEHALLLLPAEERGPHDQARLREIADELDQIWDRLSDRARRLAHGRRVDQDRHGHGIGGDVPWT